VERLRVLDAAGQPRKTSRNNQNPTQLIAQKGARMIQEDARAR
jgi:choline dehydrogenase